PPARRAGRRTSMPTTGTSTSQYPAGRTIPPKKTRRSGPIEPGLESAPRGEPMERGDLLMKWVTRENAKVDRIACPWLIRRFVDPDAEFLFVSTSEVLEVAACEGAIPFDVKGVELGHVDGRCSFESIMLKYDLSGDPALVALAK